MKRVLSYSLEIDDSQVIQIPAGADILYTLWKPGEDAIRLYTLVDTSVTKVDSLQVEILGTGHERDSLDGFKFLGTVISYHTGLVFHVFYKYIKYGE